MQRASIFAAYLLVAPLPAIAQTFPVADPVLSRLWQEGMTRSQAMALMQALTDSIGPRLTGTPGIRAGQDWLVSMYTRWGVPAKNEAYGTWLNWRRGVTHLDLVRPRVRSLEAMMLAWSAGTGGKTVEAAAVALPDFPDAAAFQAWLPNVKDKIVLMSLPQITCRPDTNFRAYALKETMDALTQARAANREKGDTRPARAGVANADALSAAIENAGAAALVTSNWSQGWGVNKIFGARTRRVPNLDVSCEDYGLIYRLAERNQGAVLRLFADAEFQGEAPVANTIARIEGKEKPNEYVMLSAHFDSWDGSSGATDNGTGTITMLEAMRILKAVYPNPKRTIIVGHWSGEEQGLNGSGAFVQDNPKVVEGLQALFNQDNGTGRVVRMSASGFVNASQYLARWLTRIPNEITRHITFTFPGTPPGGGSDHASFGCAGAPAFGVGSLDWEYGTYTWHTNRDTYDKVIEDEIKNNAVLVAMLAYLASEEPDRMPRDRRVTGTSGASAWPTCRTPARAAPTPSR